MSEREIGLSKWIFEKIKQKLSDPRKIGYAVSNTLGISSSNAYKRIRGDSKLTADELFLLLTEFDIDIQEFEGITQLTSHLSAIRPSFIRDVSSLTQYLEETRGMLSAMTNIGHTLYYSARDMPLFHYFFSDNLARFKHLIWLRSTNYSESRKLRMEDISLGILWNSRELFDLYGRMTTLELWSERTISNMLVQINFVVENLILEKEEARRIVEDLKQLIKHLHANCQEDSAHQLYLMPYLNMANNAYIETHGIKTVFLSFADINYIRTSNASMCADMKVWFEQQKLLAIHLNKNPVRADRLFRLYLKQIEDMENSWSDDQSEASNNSSKDSRETA